MSSSATGQRVIFNADDFGRGRAINEAVIRAHREGVLTTTSLMVNGDAFEEAVELAKANPTLGVGLHLTLVMGRSTLPPSQIPGLVNQSGELSDHPVAAGMRCFFGPSLRRQLDAEIGAQIEKFCATGLRMDHLNGHLNFHLHPTVFGIVIRQIEKRFAKRAIEAGDVGTFPSSGSSRGDRSSLESAPATGEDRATFLPPDRGDLSPALPAIRLTRDPFWLNAKIAHGRWAYRASHALIFNLLSLRVQSTLRRLSISHTDAVFGLLQNARVTEDYLLKLLPRLPPGDIEIYSHPCLERFPEEFTALTSPFVRGLTKKLGIKLCRYQDL